MSNQIVTTERLNFRGTTTSIQFDAQKAKYDRLGRKIEETYTTKEEFAESLEGIAENADIAKDSAKNAKYNADKSTDAVNNIKKVIDEAVKNAGANIDTILAGSTVASQTAQNGVQIKTVDNYQAQANNDNVDALNGNSEVLKQYVDAMIDLLRQLVAYGVFDGVPSGGIQIPAILDKYITLAKAQKLQAVSGNTNLTGAWDFPINLV